MIKRRGPVRRQAVVTETPMPWERKKPAFIALATYDAGALVAWAARCPCWPHLSY